MNRQNRAFTLVELLVVVSIIALLIGLLLPALQGARGKALQIQDAANLRSIHSALVIWAQSNDEAYPNPNRLDRADVTENEANPGFSKNRTGAIMSAMLFNQSVDRDMLVSPAEANENIVPISEEEYEFRAPIRAADQSSVSQALYDPGFKGTPYDDDSYNTAISAPFNSDWSIANPMNDRSEEGNFSYAHVMPAQSFLRQWSAVDATADQAILGNRGPMMSAPDASKSAVSFTAGSVQPNLWEPAASPELIRPSGDRSPSLRIHGGSTTWEGNVAFNDGHVTFYQNTVIDDYTIPAATPMGDTDTYPDQIFYIEGRSPTQQSSGSGSYLNASTDAFLASWSASVAQNADLSDLSMMLPNVFSGRGNGFRFAE